MLKQQGNRSHMMQEHYEKLHKHYESIKDIHLRQLLKDESRNKLLLARFENLVYDFTHQKIQANTLTFLHKLVQDVDLRNKILQLFNGNAINTTENRKVLHTCLRAPLESTIHSKDESMKTILKDVHEVLESIRIFSDNIRKGMMKGASGLPLINLIVIGIGGSYLSIQFIYEALKSHPEYIKSSRDRQIRFLANVDPIDLHRATEGLDPKQTRILGNSKTFTTAQTILNAQSCRQWLLQSYFGSEISQQEIVGKHVCACSTNLQGTGKFGIKSENVFGFWDFVGGRFSVWSAIGVLPLSIHYGYDVVYKFLQGGHSMDQHFLREQQIHKNIPIMLGLIGFYHNTIQGYTSRAIVPYCQALCKFAPHIQQLDMQSNGKRVDINGHALNYKTTVVNFGEPGTNAQHSFFQLLHQGRITPVQFIGFTKSQQPYHLPLTVPNHDELMSNFFSQPDALAVGKSSQELRAQKTQEELIGHKQFPGDRPSSSLLFLHELDAYHCGQLLALYEHRTSVEGFIWNINSYDQFGVELGKVLAKSVRETLKNNNTENYNSATKSLLELYIHHK